MKNILIPTDFSSNAAKAVEYALPLANRLGARITLLHTYTVPSRTGMFISVEPYIVEDAERSAREITNWLQPRLQNGASVEVQIVRGETASTIAALAEEGEIDLILMGTQGASGLAEVFLGSVTQAVLRRTKKPVLAVPAGLPFEEQPQAFVLAVDDEELDGSGFDDFEAGDDMGGGLNADDTAGVLRPLVDLAKVFDASVRVFHLEQKQGDAGIDPALDRLLSAVKHSFHYELEATENIDIKERIDQFVRESGASLLCMIRRERGFLERLLEGSHTTREVFSSPTPLLILHDV